MSYFKGIYLDQVDVMYMGMFGHIENLCLHPEFLSVGLFSMKSVENLRCVIPAKCSVLWLLAVVASSGT